MAIKKGTKIKSMFTNENVLGLKEHNSLLQKKEEVLTYTPDIVAGDPSKSKPKRDTVPKKVINKTKSKKETTERKDGSKETKVVDDNSPIQLTLKTQNRDKKKYVTFFMRESTIALIAEYAGRGAGKDRTGYDKSEFVDLIIVKAINALRFNKEE
ncbi:hypothetical protein KPL35_15865 [Clostridium sp. CF011]|uniref:hypothetical protein n=1 Tax=Clostridium sp. CF011 TaxID=2843318 RepID=UPI001C0CBD2E|nr:hypothetical protein [Clostridium sp. CF011]MBU3093535.1 hypothetical protein [Clostridium sp. CF011]WAG71729.1 hypothetical protein LL036_18325 [Clostridium sp. CF011]